MGQKKLNPEIIRKKLLKGALSKNTFWSKNGQIGYIYLGFFWRNFVDKGQKTLFFASKKVENQGIFLIFFWFAKNDLKVFISFWGKKNTI